MKETGAELSEQAVAGLKATLDRMEQQFEQISQEPVKDDIRTRPTRGEDRSTRTKLELASECTISIEDALSRAQSVSEGGAFTYVERRAKAWAAQEGENLLSGMPFAVKDLIAVAGRPIGACSPVRKDVRPEAVDAPIVAHLREAGAVFVGTTSLHEFAFGVTGVNAFCGTTVNPHDATRIAGGSSTGSAVAVAEKSAWIALGTDTGGSIRIPAALCGVVGIQNQSLVHTRFRACFLSPPL